MYEGDLTHELKPEVDKGDLEPMNTDPPIKMEDPDLDSGFPFFNRLEDPINLMLDIDDFGDEDDVRTMTPLTSDSESDSDDVDSAVDKVCGPSESQPEPTILGTLRTDSVIVIEDSSPELESSKSRSVMRKPTSAEEEASPTSDALNWDSDSELTSGNSLISDGMRLRWLR